MPAADELYPPAQYGGIWLLLAFAVIAALIAAAWLLIALTRPKRSIALPGQPSQAPPATAEILGMLRTEYSDRIDRIAVAHRDGSLTPRQTNLELSRAVRAFVNDYSGLEAPVLALDDLKRLGVQPALIEAVQKHYYPGIFRSGPQLDPIDGIEAARRVVTTWH